VLLEHRVDGLLTTLEDSNVGLVKMKA